ncbi:MAG: hypothetical protein K6G88_06610 [Lachnospiraceae bacterium]|nr:hypothetical protein [Lachnospiraceae bacterium]
MIGPILVIALSILAFVLLPFDNTFNSVSLNSIWECSSNYSEKIVITKVDSLYYTGYSVSHTFNKTFGYYYAIDDDKCFFVLIPVNHTPAKSLTDYRLAGKVVHKSQVESYSPMIKNLASDLNWNIAGLYTYSPDYVICSNEYHPLFFLGASIILLAGIITSLIMIILLLSYIIVPESYNFCPGATKAEKLYALNHIATDKSENILFDDSHIILTDSYLFFDNSHKVLFFPLNYIIWAYRMGTTGKNIFKRNTPKFSLILTLRSGKTVTFPEFSGDSSHAFLSVLHSLHRGIILGYTDEKRDAAKQLVQEIEH